MKNTSTVRFRVYGIVQGVGFRPTVDRHAKTAGVRGSVCNKGPYVEIYAQGTEAEIDRFHRLLDEAPPRRAAILKIDTKPAPDAPFFSEFSIVESEKTSGEIYISPANYRTFLQELVTLNLFHYPSAESGTFPKEFFLPGTDVKVVMSPGLEGVNNVALASFPDNLRYGCDMENDQEDVAVKYDSIKELFYVKALWNSGVQVAFPGKAYWMSL